VRRRVCRTAASASVSTCSPSGVASKACTAAISASIVSTPGTQSASHLPHIGVVDLAGRSVRWRVPIRWYLVALFTVPVGATLISLAIFGPRALAAPGGGWPRALAEVAAVFLLQQVLFQLAEEIGFT